MDVLMGSSLDIRELLSAQELESTTPLSAPDLRLLVDRLNTRSLQIKDRVRSYLVSHHHQFSILFSRASLSLNLSQSLSSDLSTLLSLLSPPSPYADPRLVLHDIRRRSLDVRHAKEALHFLNSASRFIHRLQLVRDDLRAGSVLDAAIGLRDLKAAVPTADADSDAKEPAIYGFLREEWMNCFNLVQGVLARTMENAVVFEEESQRVRVRYQVKVGETEGVELLTVLKAIDIVSVFYYGLAKVADLIIKHVISPIIRDPSVTVLVERPNEESEQKYGAILSLVCSSDFQSEGMSGATIFARLINVIMYIYESIFFCNGTWMRSFGRLTWPRISELVITDFLSKVVPDDASKLADFQNIVKLSTDFETALKKIMFISSTDGKDDKLSTFAQNVEVHFASRKKGEILAKARNLLLQSEFDLPVPEKCFVSKAASHLIELAHQTLQGVCTSSCRVAMEFYHAVRDALLLYEAMVPIKLEKQLNTISQLAVVVHSDCLYLSHEISGIAFQYRSDFPTGVKERPVFVDVAMSFYQMAEEILQKQIQLVIVSLREAIDGAEGFQNTHQMQQFESAKFSIDQVVFILEKVRILWEPLLLPSTYKRTMSTVLDFVFSRIAEEILVLDDMGADETLQLQKLIHLVLENLSSLFESLVTSASDNRQSRKSFTRVHIDELIPSLRKLRKLADLLDMPLKSITTTWESGELIDCGFTSSEVQNFVKAIFQDSPLRKECLWRIGSA